VSCAGSYGRAGWQDIAYLCFLPATLRLVTPTRARGHIQRLVDGLVGDPHSPIIGEVDRQPVGDLLGAPRPRPTPVLAAAVPSPYPPNRRTPNRRAVRGGHLAGEPVLHVLAQLGVAGKLGWLGPPRLTLGLPLRDRRPVLQLAASRRCVAAQLTRDRRRRATQLPGDLAYPELLGVQQWSALGLMEAWAVGFMRPPWTVGADGSRWPRALQAGCDPARRAADAGSTTAPTRGSPTRPVRRLATARVGRSARPCTGC
jgi:hypothetical protein